MKKIKLLFAFVLFSVSSKGQITKIDSVSFFLNEKHADSIKIRKLIEFGQTNEQNDTLIAEKSYQNAIKLSQKINDSKKQALAYIHFAAFRINHNRYKEAEQLGNKALIYATKSNSKMEIGKSYNLIGNTYLRRGEYKTALNYYFKSVAIYEEIKEYKRSALVLSNISATYCEISDAGNGIKYGKKAISNALISKDSDAIGRSYFNTGAAYSLNDDFDSYIKYYLKGIPFVKKSGNLMFIQQGYYNIANGYYQKMKLDNKVNSISLKYADSSLVCAEKMGNPLNLFYSQIITGQLHTFNKQFDKAKLFFDLANQNLKKGNNFYTNKIYFNAIADLNYKQNRFKEAFDSNILAGKYSDSIFNQEKIDEISEIEIKFQTEKKELQIKTLTQQTELQDLKIKRRFWTTITLGLALLGLGGFAYSQFKNFKTKKALLLAQQESAIVEERLRIASDMHDDVGSGLSRIRYIVGAVQNGQTEQQQGLTKVTEISDDAVQKMKEIIWSLNESNQNLEDLIYYIRGQMSEMVENANVNFVCHLPERIPNVFFGWKRNRNTYLLVKESINNALKHANAKTITLDFEITNDLHISITDDGKGFDTTKNFTGNGLNNYKKRITDLKATYNLQSEIDKGTKFDFRLPLS